MTTTTQAPVAVNLDEAILTSKVRFNDKDSVLVLLSDRLVCREFASSQESFRLPLNQLLLTRQEKSNPNVLIVTGIFRDPRGSSALVQMDMRLVCVTAEESLQWVETLSSIITDSNIRKMQANERVQEQQSVQAAAAVAELKQIFPNVDDDLLLMVLQANRLDTAACIEPLLAMSDPNYKPTDAAVVETSSLTQDQQMQQDEQLAKIMQDELFMQELDQNEEMKRQIPRIASSSGSPGSQSTGLSISERLQNMSIATKKSMSDLYKRFTSGRSQQTSEPRGAQEMVSLSVRPTEEEYPDMIDEEEEPEEGDALIRPKNRSAMVESTIRSSWEAQGDDFNRAPQGPRTSSFTQRAPPATTALPTPSAPPITNEAKLVDDDWML